MTQPDLPTLWTALRNMLARMHSALGEAATLAERAWIANDEQNRVRAWLAPLIAMARKIVLLEALALARQPAPPPSKQEPRASTARKAARERKPSLRLWLKLKRTGPRVRQLGQPVLVRDIWRDRAREAQARLLNKVRFMRAPPGVALARRIEALARLIEHPKRAIRRLAQKLRATPKLAFTLGAKRMPRTRLYDNPEYHAVTPLSFNGGVAFAYPNTS